MQMTEPCVIPLICGRHYPAKGGSHPIRPLPRPASMLNPSSQCGRTPGADSHLRSTYRLPQAPVESGTRVKLSSRNGRDPPWLAGTGFPGGRVPSPGDSGSANFPALRTPKSGIGGVRDHLLSRPRQRVFILAIKQSQQPHPHKEKVKVHRRADGELGQKDHVIR